MVKPQDHIKSQDEVEWSIGSAEKVSITKNMRAQSVLTRSSSKKSNASSESNMTPIGSPEQQAVRVALTSHPMTPSYAAFAPPNAVVIGMNTKAEDELVLGGQPIQE
jgi:hypothetical protein